MVLPPNSESAQSSKSSSERSSPLEFHFLTLFPEVFPSILGSSLMGRAQKKGLAHFKTTQIRDFATDRHRTVDDTPYGGGEGMVMKVDILHAAMQSVVGDLSPEQRQKTLRILVSPQGRLFNQEMAWEFSQLDRIVIVCGHYEGLDERFIELDIDREISVGDYVLTGGELPAMVIADSVTRLLPGVVGNERSITEESLENGLLKYPQYTRPREFEGLAVPEVLLGGDHRAIRAWRDQEMRDRTARKRPDLLKK